MGNVVGSPLPGERLLHVSGVHPVVMFPVAIFVVAGVYLFVKPATLVIYWISGPIEFERFLALMCFAAAVFFMMHAASLLLAFDFVVTDRRVVIERGVLSVTVDEILRSQVEGVFVSQDGLGRLFGYGFVQVSGSGGRKLRRSFLVSPYKLRDALYQ